MQLDSRQQSVIENTGSFIVVLAPPGSGKTFTVVERIAHLIEKREVSPETILAITFTNRAARELETRISRRLPGLTTLPRASTFHALALSILKEALGETAPQLIEETKRRNILKNIGKKFGGRLKDLLLKITKHKATHLLPAEDEVLTAYNQELQSCGLIDFDDLLIHACKLLEDRVELREQLRSRFQYILVDEYQDVSPMQIRFLQLISSPTTHILVIGDPHQSIYSFRGGSTKSFAKFDSVFGESTKIHLTTNYRSTRNIIHTAHAILEVPETAPETENQAGDLVQLTSFENQKQEARWLIKIIRGLLGGTDLTSIYSGEMKIFHASEIGIIYRLNAAGNIIERYFSESGIPFERIGTKSLFEYADVQEILRKLKNKNVTHKLSESLREVIEILPEKNTRLVQLMNFAVAYDSLPPREAREKFLIDAETSRSVDTPRNENTVTFLTAHAAKGLEFAVVFIVGIEDEFFPYLKENETMDTSRLEEERRLLYVAMTRAKEQLYLTYTKSRTLFGKTYTPRRSRFLEHIPPNLLKEIAITKKQKESSRQVSLF